MNVGRPPHGLPALYVGVPPLLTNAAVRVLPEIYSVTSDLHVLSSPMMPGGVDKF